MQWREQEGTGETLDTPQAHAIEQRDVLHHGMFGACVATQLRRPGARAGRPVGIRVGVPAVTLFA